MTVEEAIGRAVREVGLSSAHEEDVRLMLTSPEEAARACCGGFCDPCVTTLRRAADRARTLIGATPP